MERVIVKEFRTLSAEQILALRPGTWGDYELLDVLGYFHDEDDEKRAAAVTELILRSPEHSEMVDYDNLYYELVQYTRWLQDYPAAVRWAHGNLAYEEQRLSGFNRANLYRDIGEIYMQAGQLDIGLAILTRCLEADPADTWNYNSLAFTLLDVEWAELALEVLDRALELVAKDDPEKLQGQLSELQEEASEQVIREEGRQAEVTPAVLARLRAAMQLSSDHPEDQDVYLPPVDGLIILEEGDAEAMYETVMAQGEILAPELIRLAFDEKLRDMPASGHAVTILRRLSAERAVELGELASWLERAEGDWPRELLTEQAGKIGGYRTGELEAIAADTTYDLYVRSAIANALVERAQKCPEQRERIVEGMRPLLTRPEAHEMAEEEEFIGLLIAEIKDLGAKELYPEIEAAFAEDRVDPFIIDLQDVQKGLGMPVSPRPKPRKDGLNLRLLCKSCGRARHYFVQHVVIDPISQQKAAAGKTVKYDPFIMDREIVCPKCGARDQYELTAEAGLQLMRPAGGLKGFAALLSGQGEEPEFELHPRAEFIQSVVFDRPMHPLEGLERYRELIAAQPQNVALYFRMGTLLRTIHRHPDALEAFRQGYERGTDDPELVLNRAMAEHDFGDRALARELYEETIALLGQQSSDDPYYFDLEQTARRGQRFLKRKRASPWQPLLLEDAHPGKERPSWRRRKKGRRLKKKKRRRK
jgi:tetratricopeptide (TPR) repeat protein